MTHDELLALLKTMTNDDAIFMKDALRAVVELHKPSVTNEINLCSVCWAISDQHNLRVMPVIYPCPTIEAIEKELL